MARYKDLSGQTFKKLYVIKLVKETPLTYKCKCICGEEILVTAAHLHAGKGSCGCIRIKKHGNIILMDTNQTQLESRKYHNPAERKKIIASWKKLRPHNFLLQIQPTI